MDNESRDRIMWMAIRQALLMFVDAIEVRYGLERTSALRKELRQRSYLEQEKALDNVT